MTIIELKQKRAGVFERLKSLHERSERKRTNLSYPEQQEWNRLHREVDDLSLQISRTEDAQRAQARETAAQEAFASPGDDELASWFRGQDPTRRVMEVGETRDLLAGSGSGQQVVPIGFLRQMREALIDVSGIRQTNATILTTASGEPLRVPRATAHPTVSAITAEAGAIGESDPTLSFVTLDAFKYANLNQLSTEFTQDEAVDIVTYLARANGRALGNGSGTHFVTGTGSGQPNGVVTAASVGKTFTTGSVAGVIPPGDIIDLFHSVIPEYRRNAYWLMSDAMAAKLRKIRDASGASADTGNLLWQPGLQAGQPDLLFGRPVVIDPNVAAPGANAKSIVFGDFSGYYIRDVGSIRFERSDDFAFGNDLVTFRAVIRTDGDLVDANSVKVGQFAAT
jgi:HK97 family phage major capsid protein